MKVRLTAGWLLLVAAAGFGAGSYATAAETYPAKPVRIIVPFSPAGFVDFTARFVAVPLSAALGQPVIVENRAGAGGVIGTEFVARSNPDGYTLVIGSVGTHAVNQALYPNLSYNVLRDFQPVAPRDGQPLVVVVKLTSAEPIPTPADLAIDHVWVLNGKEQWSAKPATGTAPSETAVRGGPKWGPGIKVDVVARLRQGKQTFLVRAVGVDIKRTD